ncbi:helix-turn-helix transcriptional regulator [Endozoicomonas atrinae]|uniref:helix-turn-helix transcriptional regulator n=1 Tax=Endozoicomonas atrinae TaxID=1333660 RepID=UPI000824317C|nr:AlpA family phage regulatory protein [Endozoicomonas atrinae]
MERNAPRFITVKEIEAEYGICRKTIWKLRQHPEFPKPVDLPMRRVLFRRSDVEQYMDSI